MRGARRAFFKHTAEQLSYEMCPYPEAPEVLERMAEAILRESADGLMKALAGVAAMRRVSPRGAAR